MHTQIARQVDAVILLRCLLRALPALSESLTWVETPLLQAVSRCWLATACVFMRVLLCNQARRCCRR